MEVGEEGGVAGVFVVEGEVEGGGFAEAVAELEDGFRGGRGGRKGDGDVLAWVSCAAFLLGMRFLVL